MSKIKITICIAAAFTLLSCGNRVSSPVECVNIFINAAYEHDMTKAWGTLGPEALAYYNEIGEKNRKSGKGILEHDVSEIKKFRPKGNDYIVINDSVNNNLVKIILNDGKEFGIITIESEGEYKIKDYSSVKNILTVIALETVNKDYY